MRIEDVEMLTVPMATSWLTERVIPSPMSIFPEYSARRSAWYQGMSAGVIRVTGEDGSVGLGFVGCGKATAGAEILREQVRALVVGKDSFQTELISDQLFRATVQYGQGGITSSLFSGIDIALWDLKGKELGRPVYDLLGGTGDPLPVYATSFDADALGKVGIERLGIADVKITPPHGPVDGRAGMRANLEAVRKIRDLLGPDGFIALDCYMGWGVPYTIEMVKMLEGLGVAWVEEPVMPEDIAGYAAIKEKVDCMVTGGEHLFTLEMFRRLIVDGGVDIVQPDIYRAGGPTVLKRIATLARTHNRSLICHGSGAPTYHFLASNGPEVTPRVEWLDISQGGSASWILSGDPTPVDGALTLPDTPGFGYELNQDAFAAGAAVAPIW
jgi:L-alanine-DL-glutamate epimerase-like enolase superfamily enzyme